MKRLIILGAGGMGREVLQCAKQINAVNKQWEIAGFLDPDEHALDGKKCDIGVIGDDLTYEIGPDDVFVCAAGTGAMRKKIMEKMEARGAKFVTLIHPTALVDDTATVGDGSIIFAYSIVSDNASIGKGCFINFHTYVAHDSVLEDYCSIYANCVICGACTLGENVTMGTSSSIIPGISVGENAYICVGSAVTRPVAAGEHVIGVPAKPREK